MNTANSLLLHIYDDLRMLLYISDPVEMRSKAHVLLEQINQCQEQHPLVQELDDIELFLTRIIEISFLEEAERNALILLIIDDLIRRRCFLDPF